MDKKHRWFLLNSGGGASLPSEGLIQDLDLSSADGNDVPDNANTGDARTIQTGLNYVTFDGNQYSIANYSSPWAGDPTTGAIGISFYFKTADTGVERRILWRDQTSKRELQVIISASGLPQVLLFKSASAYTISASNVFDDDEWHHFFFYYTQSAVYVFIDGVNDTSTTTWPGGTRDIFDSQIGLGGAYTSSSRRFIGSLADFRVYHDFDIADIGDLVRGKIFGTEKVMIPMTNIATSQFIDVVGGNNLAITGTLAYGQTYVDGLLTHSDENDRGYTVSDGSTYYYETGLSNLIPVNVRIPASLSDPTKCAAYVTGGVLGDLQYAGSVPIDGLLTDTGTKIKLNPSNAPKLRREGFDSDYKFTLGTSLIPPPAYRKSDDSRIVCYEKPDEITYTQAVAICNALGGQPANVNLSDYPLIAADGATTTDSYYINRILRASGAGKVTFDGSVTYGINGRLNIYSDVDVASTATIKPLNTYTDPTAEQIATKLRKSVLRVFRDGVTINCEGTINGNQEWFRANIGGNFFVMGIFSFGYDNVTIQEANFENVLDGVNIFDCEGWSINNIDCITPANHGDYRNAGVDLMFSSNIEVNNVHVDGYQEGVDCNGNNQYITLSNIDGDNLDEAVLEVNNSKNITADGVTGNSSVGSTYRVTAANNYSGDFYAGYTISYVCGDLNITNVEGTPSSLVVVGTGTGTGGAGAY